MIASAAGDSGHSSGGPAVYDACASRAWNSDVAAAPVACLLLRHVLKLALLASEIAIFQARLAHASYTASPPIEWPESPAAEAITNLTPSANP